VIWGDKWERSERVFLCDASERTMTMTVEENPKSDRPSHRRRIETEVVKVARSWAERGRRGKT